MINVFIKGIALAIFTLAVLVVFGNKPIINDLRFSIKKAMGLVTDFKDRQEGLNPKAHAQRLTALQQKYKSKPPLPEMASIPAGNYVMGCLAADCVENIETKGQAIAAFKLAKTELTVEQWDACVADNGCSHLPANYGWGRGDLPVVNVSWQDVQEYLNWLNSSTGENYRLPSNLEWEYAARAGSNKLFLVGDSELACTEVRHGSPPWNSPREHKCKITGTWPVNQGQQNQWGLRQMIGNAAEWTQTCGSQRLTKNGLFGTPQVQQDKLNGTQIVDCKTRINRGGNWATTAAINVFHSRAYSATHRYNRVGFRLALDLK